MFNEYYSKLSEKEKKICNIAIVIVILALFDRLFLGPVLSRIGEVDEEITKQEVSIVRDLRFLSYKDRILKESDEYKKYFSEKNIRAMGTGTTTKYVVSSRASPPLTIFTVARYKPALEPTAASVIVYVFL